jgi:hypothetical protein
MESEESGFYSVLQASRALGVSLKEVHELITRANSGPLMKKRDFY